MRIRYFTPLIILLFAFPVFADELSQQITFNIDSSFDSDGGQTAKATLRAISNNAYFYVSNDYTQFSTSNDILVLNNKLESLAKEFEEKIYPKLIGFWGSENKPGVDNDNRITVVLTGLVTYAGGYFDTSNSFPQKQFSRSNQRDMIFINTSALKDNDRIYEFISHELQHLISLNYKELTQSLVDDVWLNEMRSEYSVTVAGYNDVYIGSNIQRRVVNFSDNPYDSLTEWQNKSVDYSQAALFAEYLVDKYGSKILLDSLKSDSTGIASIPNFEQIFKNWMVANFLNEKSISDLYVYDRPELVSLRVRPTKIVTAVGGSSVLLQSDIKDWQSNWLEIRNPDTSILKIDFSGASGEKFGMPYIAFWNDGTKKVGEIDLSQNTGTFYAPNVARVVLMPFKKTKTSGFTTTETSSSFNLVIRQVIDIPAGSQILGQTTLTPEPVLINNNIQEGSLIKLKGGNDIYVIRGEWKRFLLPEIIKQYGHLDPSKAIEVDIGVFNKYKTSNYVRYINDEKVYAVWPDGTKHWFNMTGDYFISSNRSFDAIFVINELELGSYRTGVDITR